MYNLLDKGLFLKNRPRLVKKRYVRPSSRLKTVDLDCRSSLSVAQLVRFWFKSLQSLTVHDRQFLQGNLFLLAVCTHDVGLYLCSIFCIRSLLQFSAASYHAFGARNTPQLYPVALITFLVLRTYVMIECCMHAICARCALACSRGRGSIGLDWRDRAW